MLEFHNLIDAYMQCRKNKRGSSAALAFEVDYEHNLWELYNDIIDGSYKINPSTAFVVERPVKREIFASDFRDRVVHHFVMGALLSGKRLKSGLYSTIESVNVKVAADKKIAESDLRCFRDSINSINSYWGLMRHYSSYNLRCRSAKRFSAYINKVVKYPSYCKISIKKRRRIKYIDLHLEDKIN